jgi:sulfate adenylyltransferase subunit 1
MVNIEQYLKSHEQKEMVRFITCGSVDDGKSTLIGRLLYDSKSIFEDQLASIQNDSKKYGTTGEKVDLALLVDGLQSEREQGITIDVAYRFFATDKRKFIIADTPGHEQYTRNMVTGASTADVAIILIDARLGVLTQTKRHSYIVSLLGIKQIIVAINKMDLVDFDEGVYHRIKKEYEAIIPKLSHAKESTFHYIPLCALNGDNVFTCNDSMPWYKGASLMQLLESVPLPQYQKSAFRLPIQYVNRPHLNFRGFCGTIASGDIAVGQNITVLPSKKTSKVKSIITHDKKELGAHKRAFAPMAVTLTLEDEIDISRGDVVVASHALAQCANKFSVMMVWMDEASMQLGKSYSIKRATTVANVRFESIIYKKDINKLEEISTKHLELNDIAKCTLVLDKEMAFDAYEANRTMGSFIIIDKHTNNTVGAGMILSSIIQDKELSFRVYTKEDIELNAYIRQQYPEWECKEIYE